MQKVLILSYFFPPCNLTASQRAYGWAKYLNMFGYYPVIITRSWQVPISKPEDGFKKSGNEIVIEKQEGFEIHYLPYFPSLRDKLFISKNKNSFSQFLQKTLTFVELLSYGFTSFFISYKNIYQYACDYLKKNNDIKALVVTANPFVMFKFGYLLNKEFGIKWIADYRDDWGTSDLTKPITFPEKLIAYLDKRNEKKWVSSASLIMSISEHYVKKISSFTNVKGEVILNGYLKEDAERLNTNMANCFTIVYNGTLYNTQPVEEVLEGFRFFVNKYPTTTFKLLFVGAAFDPVQEQRILKKAEQLNLLPYIEVTNRKPKVEVMQIQKSAHVLLMIAHKGYKGVPSSKLYEYLSLAKPVVSYPCDEDIIDETLKGYNLGYTCASKQLLTSVFDDLYAKYKDVKYSELVADELYIELFSREHQTKKLAEMLRQFKN